MPRYVSHVPIHICFSYSHTTSRRARCRQRWSVRRGISGSSRCIPLSISFVTTVPSRLVLRSLIVPPSSVYPFSFPALAYTPTRRHISPHRQQMAPITMSARSTCMPLCRRVRARRVPACRAMLADGRCARAEFAHTRTRTMPVICTTPYLLPPAVSLPIPVPAPPLRLPTHIAPHLLSFVGTRPMSVRTYILNKHVFPSEFPV